MTSPYVKFVMVNGIKVEHARNPFAEHFFIYCQSVNLCSTPSPASVSTFADLHSMAASHAENLAAFQSLARNMKQFHTRRNTHVCTLTARRTITWCCKAGRASCRCCSLITAGPRSSTEAMSFSAQAKQAALQAMDAAGAI